MIKKTLLAIFTFMFLAILPVKAQTASDSSVTQKLKTDLKKPPLKLWIPPKKNSPPKPNPPQKAYIGTIKTIDSQHITLEYKSTNYSIDLTDKTEIVKAQNLKPNDFIIAMGFIFPDNPNLQAARVLLVDEPDTTSPRQLISGPIQEIDAGKISVGGKILTLTSKTNLQIPDVKNPTAEDLELADNLFAIVTLDKNGDINKVNSVFVLPGKNNPAALTPTNASQPPTPTTTDSAKIDE